MEKQQIEQVALTVIGTVLKREFGVGQDVTRQNTPGWDSLKHIEIMFAMEDELGMEFSEEELAHLDSVAKIVAAVQAKHAA